MLCRGHGQCYSYNGPVHALSRLPKLGHGKSAAARSVKSVRRGLLLFGTVQVKDDLLQPVIRVMFA